MENPFFCQMLHGGDYNPEQWLGTPEILEKDIVYFKKMHINTVSLGIFSWAMLEPHEGVFSFEWLLDIIDRLHCAGISVIMATPSGARPKWLADTYPEVLRVDKDRRRALFGGRHNHCYTSPIYRKKVRIINTELAHRVGAHPAVIAWHISNEYGGECHCPLCQEEFRLWLRERYKTIDAVNEAWQTIFWSHVYNSFSQIESPSSIGENCLHGLNLDWKRFVTAKTVDFAAFEIQSLRSVGCRQPVTVNLMYDYAGLDYQQFSGIVDIISWDNYPLWHKKEEKITAVDTAVQHDYMRSLQHKPFLLMESCPSATNWQSVSKLKRPGMLLASSLQAVAHGADSVMYFQMRQSRGASEKFHGAAIDHWGGESRVMNEITSVGIALEQLSEVHGSTVSADVAIIMDRESRWAMEDSFGPRNTGLRYMELFQRLYSGLCSYGVNIDIVAEEQDLRSYRVVILPMVYMFKDGFAEKIRSFVFGGGTVVVSYWSGIVDGTDRCYLNGVPHGILDVLGVRSVEIDALYDDQSNIGVPVIGNTACLTREYRCDTFCNVLEIGTAVPVLTYADDFYAGQAALSYNHYGAGTAWYIGALFEKQLFIDLLHTILLSAGVYTVGKMLFGGVGIPDGVFITSRENSGYRYVFIQNYNRFTVILPTVLSAEVSVLYGKNTGVLRPLETIVFKVAKSVFE